MEHCGLALEGRALLLDGLFAELSADVDSRGLALEDCVVITSLGKIARQVVCQVVGSIVWSKMDHISS